MKPKIEAVIFDADGTILDTREVILRSFEHSLAVHGHVVPPRDHIQKHTGPALVECYTSLVPSGDHEKLSETHKSFQKGMFHLVERYESVCDVFQTLKDAGIKIGVCTNRSAHVVDLLKDNDLDEYETAVKTIACAELTTWAHHGRLASGVDPAQVFGAQSGSGIS